MAIEVVYANANDFGGGGFNASYATARTGASTLFGTGATVSVGQYLSGGTYVCSAYHGEFDLSAVVGEFESGTLNLKVQGKGANYGASRVFEMMDFTGASFAAISGASLSPSGSAVTLTSATTTLSFPLGGIDKAQLQRYRIYDQRHRTNSAPTGFEQINAYTADETGTTNDPFLSLVTTTPAKPRSYGIIIA